jgi:hypothetical protein
MRRLGLAVATSVGLLGAVHRPQYSLRRQREREATADREQGPMGHLLLLDAQGAEDQHCHTDGVRANAGVGQRGM